jgi:hypothetical protein
MVKLVRSSASGDGMRNGNDMGNGNEVNQRHDQVGYVRCSGSWSRKYCYREIS